MKSKFLLIPAVLLGVTALGGAAVGLAHNNFARSAKAEESCYAITDSMYDVAFFEQYNDVANCISTEDYSYANDKPIGSNSIGGHLYGTYGNNATNLKQTNYETTLMGGVNENLQWRFSGLNVKGKGDPNRLYIQLENNSSSWNICNATSFPQATSPDEYALGQLVTAAGCTKGASMVSIGVIQNIKDMSFYWRSSYSKKVLICYQLENDSTWKVFHTMNMNDSEKIVGNYSGTRGWDKYGYTTFNSSSWTEKELYGANARIAFVCTEAPTESGSFPLSAVVINANNAAVRYLNVLTYNDNICSDNGTDLTFNLNKGQNDKVHNQDLFQLATERADGSFLANYQLQGTKTNDRNALSFYNHLVGAVSGLGDAKSASSNFFKMMNLGNSANVALIASISVAAAAVIGTGLFFSLKKRKHQ